MPHVRFDRVEKRYGDKPVIRDLTLTVRDGEFFTLVGPSGCGKSTVLNLVAGLEPVTSGEIYFDDRAVTHLSPKGRDVAMVFQSYALYPHKTVFENLAFPLRVRKRTQAIITHEVRRVAALLGIEGLLVKEPAELSGGERQRVALGRAIIREPAVFLMDEPLSNLDAHLRVRTRSELKRLHARLKTTTLYVTHDQEEALSLSERIAVMKEGSIQQMGSPLEIYRFPANTFVAEFVGSPQINLLSGRLSWDPAPYVELGHVRLALPPVPESPVTVGPQRPPCNVIVGIRPEDIRVLATASPTSDFASVISVEPAGGRSVASLRWGPHEIRALAAGDFQAAPDQTVGIELEAARIHVFDACTGRRLPWDGPLTPRAGS